ncbi:ribosomal-protein-alanine N-acetyltransferase [Murinocardiopsis flavida]|uniref:Ribosomal-protein-alanine N-acetyltransferase n=1 Tax=Murinocardiopsis flavida TaxID=645275 RepID=A0A2P8CQW7_9ACTN|nr:GNAT family protein [Murinocardiopsis flavida]PSK87359.1 ribosomal-protein-alanine N-acetyltransferase [Murinocardiopsis flavida]
MPHNEYLAEGPRVAVRRVTRRDEDGFTAAIRASAALHHPWVSMPATPVAFHNYVARFDGSSDVGLVVCERRTDRLAGFVNINNIVGGALQSGALGYAAFAGAEGRGYISEGVGLVVGFAFAMLGLHRLEANIQPDNAPSRRLVQRNGFRLEGYSPEFLFVNGAWRDHERWATLRPKGTIPTGSGPLTA